MRLIEQYWEWINKPINPLQTIELAGRNCWKSESKIHDDSSEKFVKNIIKVGHESVIEHSNATIRLVTNRGVLAEITRHRIGVSFSVESTRYVKYDNVDFILPVWWCDWSTEEQNVFMISCQLSENYYKSLINLGSRPEQAREVLPQALKTDIIMSANFRSWRNIFKLRCSNAAHPQIRYLMRDVLDGFKKEIPVVFDDLNF